MKIQYSDEHEVGELLESIEDYRHKVQAIVNAANFSEAESSLATWQDDLMRTGVNEVRSKLGKVSHVVLVGIGGSSLGTEAIYAALGRDDTPQLHVLDSVSDHNIQHILTALKDTDPLDIAICIISKSGGTNETMANASVLLDELGNLYGEVPYGRAVAIGNKDNRLLRTAEDKGMFVLPMHESVGGRYSVFTAVGLVPLILLGYDVNEVLDGLKNASNSEYEAAAAVGAARLYKAMQNGTRLVNFFVFDSRLEKLGAWYRQLAAESLGKETDRDDKPVTIGFVPSISTAVELHSIGQLYFSGFKGVYTDFISVEERPLDHYVDNRCDLAPHLAGKSLQEIAYAIEGGVVGAYEERALPFRYTELKKINEYDLGLFMGVRMLETMYLAEMMNVDAFNQPNVELYKTKTKAILNGESDS